MKTYTTWTVRALAGVLSLGVVGHAVADFTGQTILGPLGNSSVVNGNTTGQSDDNDGFTSGTHIFDIWDGGDDVWQLDWLGGDLTVNLTSLSGSDNDLFLYTPADYNDSAIYSIVGSFDTLSLPAAPAGTYFLVVDSTEFTEGPYTLEVVPTPSVLAVAGLGAIIAGRRRR